jgi:hypothetical protein
MKNAEMFKVTSLLFEGKEEVLDEAGFFDKIKNKISGNKAKTASGPQPKNNQDWEDYQEPQKPNGNAATAVQRPAGAQLPQQIGSGVAKQPNQQLEKPPRAPTRGSTAYKLEQFSTTLEVNMANINKVAEKVAQNNLPREHFKAHLDILSNMDNVYTALGKASDNPKVKQASVEMNADLRGAMKTLLKYTKGTKTA